MFVLYFVEYGANAGGLARLGTRFVDWIVVSKCKLLVALISHRIGISRAKVLCFRSEGFDWTCSAYRKLRLETSLLGILVSLER